MAQQHFIKPVPFRATGRGYFNRLPRQAATSTTGNAVLTNPGVGPRHPHHKLWLYVTQTQTGWSISGDYGQSPYARTFYPQQLQQDDFIITGVVPNQYEYDRITEFVQRHHDSALQADTSPGAFPLDFKLFPYRIPVRRDRRGRIVYRYIHRGVHLELFIQNHEAGHERFVNAPTWTLPCKVSNDFLQQQRSVKGYVNDALQKNYLQVFGGFYKQPQVKGVYLENIPPFVDVESRDAWYNERPDTTISDMSWLP